MNLTFAYLPVQNMAAALGFYRDLLGFQEAWREGATTVSLTLPGTEVQLMIDEVVEPSSPGPAFLVDSVQDFYVERRSELAFTGNPEEIPGGYWAAFDDPAGNRIYVLDQSTAG